MRIDGIILAAGLSSRMKTNKMLLSYRGKSFLQHTVDLVADLPFASRILVTRPDSVVGLWGLQGMRVVFNSHPELGQSSSLRLGLASADGDGYMFFTADQPFLDRTTVERILAAANPESIVVPRYETKMGSPVFFSSAFRTALLAVQGDSGGKSVRETHAERCMYVDVERPDVLLDVDTPEQYAALCAVPKE